MGPMIIGAPKSIDDFPVLAEQEQLQFAAAIGDAIRSGVPVEMPSIMLTLQDAARLAKTLAFYRARMATLEVPLTAVAPVETPVTSEEAPKLDISRFTIPS